MKKGSVSVLVLAVIGFSIMFMFGKPIVGKSTVTSEPELNHMTLRAVSDLSAEEQLQFDKDCNPYSPVYGKK